MGTAFASVGEKPPIEPEGIIIDNKTALGCSHREFWHHRIACYAINATVAIGGVLFFQRSHGKNLVSVAWVSVVGGAKSSLCCRPSICSGTVARVCGTMRQVRKSFHLSLVAALIYSFPATFRAAFQFRLLAQKSPGICQLNR